MTTITKTLFKFIMMIIIQYLLLFFTLSSLFDNYNVAIELTNRLASQPIIAFIIIVVGILCAKSDEI